MIVLPDNLLRLMTPADRKRYGAGFMTAEEAIEKARAGEEDKLQSEVRQYLNLHALQFINPSMRKRSALPPGWPDFTFCYKGTPMVVECKTEAGRLSPEQQTMRIDLIRNGWTYVLAQSVKDVQTAFRAIDSNKSPWPIVNP